MFDSGQSAVVPHPSSDWIGSSGLRFATAHLSAAPESFSPTLRWPSGARLLCGVAAGAVAISAE